MFNIRNPFSGVTDEFKRKIFRRGYSTKDKKGENHGEGLYILRSYIRYYKGSVNIVAQKIDDVDYVSFCIKL